MPAVSIGEIVDFVGRRVCRGPRSVDHRRGPPGPGAARPAQLPEQSQIRSPSRRDQGRRHPGAKNLEGDDPRWIRVDDPYFAFAAVMTRWFSHRPMPRGVSPKAGGRPRARNSGKMSLWGISPSSGMNVVIGNNVTIFQGVSIEAGSVVGDDCIIYPNVAIYDGSRIGQRCIIHSGRRHRLGWLRLRHSRGQASQDPANRHRPDRGRRRDWSRNYD